MKKTKKILFLICLTLSLLNTNTVFSSTNVEEYSNIIKQTNDHILLIKEKIKDHHNPTEEDLAKLKNNLEETFNYLNSIKPAPIENKKPTSNQKNSNAHNEKERFYRSMAYLTSGAILVASIYGTSYYYGLAPSPSQIYTHLNSNLEESLYSIYKTLRTVGKFFTTSYSVVNNQYHLWLSSPENAETKLTQLNQTLYSNNTSITDPTIEEQLLQNVEDLSKFITYESLNSVHSHTEWGAFHKTLPAARMNTIILGPITILNYMIIGAKYNLNN